MYITSADSRNWNNIRKLKNKGFFCFVTSTSLALARVTICSEIMDTVFCLANNFNNFLAIGNYELIKNCRSAK